MNACKLLKNIGLIATAMMLTACGSGDFNYGKVGNLISGAPMHLDAEYVTLTLQQLDCGVQNDLWDPASDSGGRGMARLKDRGRSLHFADDVFVGDMKLPYVQ